jgi:hypothetical protein
MLGRLTLLDLAAGKFPKPSEGTPRRSLGDQDSALAVKEHAGGDENEWWRPAFHRPGQDR